MKKRSKKKSVKKITFMPNRSMENYPKKEVHYVHFEKNSDGGVDIWLMIPGVVKRLEKQYKQHFNELKKINCENDSCVKSYFEGVMLGLCSITPPENVCFEEWKKYKIKEMNERSKLFVPFTKFNAEFRLLEETWKKENTFTVLKGLSNDPHHEYATCMLTRVIS